MPFEVFDKFYEQLGLDSLINGTRKDEDWNRTLRALTFMRPSSPKSKKMTSLALDRHYSTQISLEKIYRTMDKVFPFIDEAKKKDSRSYEARRRRGDLSRPF